MESPNANNGHPIFEMPSVESMPAKAASYEYETVASSISHEPAPKQTNTALNAISALLFALSILSIFFSSFTLTLLSELFDPVPFTHGWIYIIFIPIPIASFVFGIVVKVNDCRYIKNIVIGAIMTSLILLFSIMFGFLSADEPLHDDAPVLRAELATSVDLPAHYYINTYTYDSEDEEHLKWQESFVYIEDDVAEAFEEHLPDDTRWLQIMPNDFIGLQPVIEHYTDGEYIIFYNVTTGEMNKTPAASGRYDFIQIIYEPKDNQIVIWEYVLDYVK